MAKGSFKQWLDEKQFKGSMEEETPFTRAVRSLDEIVAGIQEDVPHKDIIVRMEPGFTVNLGTQYRVVLGTKDGKFNVTLFRAYVALDGSKVSFDFYDEQPTESGCDRDSIFEAVSTFLVRPTTIAQFHQVADYLNRKSNQGT